MADDSRTRAAYAQLSLAADALQVDDSQPFDELKAALIAKLRAAWGKDGHRISLVHIENVNAAFVHATVKVMDTDEVKAVWPYWRLNAVMDQKTSRICDSLNNVVRPAGEGWWYAGHIPPLHFGGCRSVIEGLTLKEAHKIGVTPYYPMIEAQHGFGHMNRAWTPDLSKFPPELTAIYSKATQSTGSLSLRDFAAGIAKRWAGPDRRTWTALRALRASRYGKGAEKARGREIRAEVKFLWSACAQMLAALSDKGDEQQRCCEADGPELAAAHATP